MSDYQLDRVVVLDDEFDVQVVLSTEQGPPGPPGANGTSAARASRLFTSAELTVANLLVYQHDLGNVPTSILVLDQNKEVVDPDRRGVLTDDVVFLDLTSFTGFPGTWEIIVGA
jgi:hypothetical protein